MSDEQLTQIFAEHFSRMTAGVPYAGWSPMTRQAAIAAISEVRKRLMATLPPPSNEVAVALHAVAKAIEGLGKP